MENEMLAEKKLTQSVISIKPLLLKKVLYAGSYFLVAALIEIITFATLGYGFYPVYVSIDIAIIFVLASLVFIIPGFWGKTAAIGVLLLVQCLLSFTNVTLVQMGQPIFSLSQIELLGEAGEVFQVSMLNFGFMAELLAIFSIEMTATVFMHKIRVAANLNLHIIILLLAVFSLSLAASMSLFGGTIKAFASSSDTEDSLSILTDDFYLWETQYNNTAAFKKFGTFGYYCKNIENYFFSGSDSDGNNATDILTTDWSSELGVSSYGDNIMTGKFEGQNVVLIVIESGEWYAINKEYTPTLYALASQGIAMTNYYARDKTDKSEALAILGSYPIRNSSAIYNAGLSDHNFAFTSANILGADGYTTNYFHPGAAGFYSRKTTHGDMYGFDNLRFVDSSDRLENAYGQSEWYDFQRDSEMISQYLDEYMQVAEEDSAFFTMMMTMMTHGHYEDLVNYGDYTKDLTDAEKEALSSRYVMQGLEDYYEIIDDFPRTYIDDRYAIAASKYNGDGSVSDWYLYYKRYQAGLMDLDVGVNRLIYALEEQGELDNTTFVFYADHYSYYDSINYALKDIPMDKFWDLNDSNIPFFIWSGSCMNLDVENMYEGYTYENTEEHAAEKSVYEGEYYYAISHHVDDPIGGTAIEKSCSSFDVLPTILDLLGYEYKQGLYHGISVFKDEIAVFVSRETGAAFMENYYYDGSDLYIKAETVGSVTTSADGQIIFSGNVVQVQKSGEFVTYNASDLKQFFYVQKYGDYIVLNVVKGSAYFSDAASEFLQKVVAYYAKQEILEDMYEYDMFSYVSIDLCVRKV